MPEAFLALGPFLEELEARLRALAPDDLRAALLAHGERLTARERKAFLAIFADARPEAEVEPRGAEQPLLAEIEALVERLRAGAYVEGWGWDPDLHEERAFGDESWAWEMDGLFAVAAQAFLEGDLKLAREAYGQLLRALLLDEEGAFSGPGPAAEMLETDVSEAKARYLRTVYETTVLPERAAGVAAELAALGSVGGATPLRSLGETRRDKLPDLAAFLRGWIELLAADGEGLGAEGLRLLIEAVRLQRGSAGLADLARERGARHPEIYLAWVDALGAEDAAAACREALERLEPHGEVLAQIAERLALLAEREEDGDAVLEARRAAWRAAPSTERLLTLLDTATALGVADEALATEADLAERAGMPGSDRLACELLLLGGRVEAALGLLRAASPLGWSSRGHSGPVVVPYLLAAACGAAPPGADTPVLAEQFRDMDREGWYSAAFSLSALDAPRSDPDDPEHRSGEPRLAAALGRRLASQALDDEAGERWLAAARTKVEERTAAVVETKHRGAYERVARLVVACAEAIALAQGAPKGGALVSDLRERYPRHSAFQAELDRAVRRSPLLPPPPRRRK